MPNSDKSSVRVPLAYPVTVDAVEYKELTVRRAKITDQLRATKAGTDEMSRAVRMVALLTGTADDVIEELDLQDFGSVSKVVESFMGLPSAATN